MSLGYIQVFEFHPESRNGKVFVYIAGSPNTKAQLYDPVSEAVISNPVDIDSEGYSAPYKVSTSANYDIVIKTWNGEITETRQNVEVLAGSGGGSDGHSVYLTVNPDGSATITDDFGQSTTISDGEDGTDGINGTDGTNGTNGIDGTNGVDGVSLDHIRINPTSTTAEVLYKLSNGPTEYSAGDILPDGYGTVKVSESDTFGYLGTKIVGTDGQVTIVNDGSTLTFSIDPALFTRIETLETAVEDHEERITVLEDNFRAKQVIFCGSAGATEATATHTLGTSNLVVGCYDTITNVSVYLNVVVTDTHLSVSGLTPLTTSNQIKFVVLA